MSNYLIWPAVFQVLPSRDRLRLKSSARTRTTGRVTSAICRQNPENTPSTWRVMRRTSNTAPSWLTSSLTTTPVTQIRSVRYTFELEEELQSNWENLTSCRELFDQDETQFKTVKKDCNWLISADTSLLKYARFSPDRLGTSLITHTGSVVVGPGLRAGAWEDRLPGQPTSWVHCQR